MIKVYFKEFWCCKSNFCNCEVEDFYTFSHIEGVSNSEQHQSYDYEMYNGTKASEWDCLVSVFWDLVADKRQYNHFYDFWECVDDVSYDDLESMLSCKGIEVVFISEEDYA